MRARIAGTCRRRQGALLAALAALAVVPAAAAPEACAASHKPASKPHRRPRRPKPIVTDPDRAVAAYKAMQSRFYLPGHGLYRGAPYSTLWDFSQALAATVSLGYIPHVGGRMLADVRKRLFGLSEYREEDADPALGRTAALVQKPPEPTKPAIPVAPVPAPGDSGPPPPSQLAPPPPGAAYDAAVAPPLGDGADRFYDDNEWVGIELVRAYQQGHDPTVLARAQEIMAFVMRGWQLEQGLRCPGGLPFSDALANGDRNTVTDAPGAELGAMLYRITGQFQYIYYARLMYQWVRGCLLSRSAGLYADHIDVDGNVDRTYWSYNQGTMIGAGVLLYQATGEHAYLDQANATALAAGGYFTPAQLEGETPFFPAVYFRNLLLLDSVSPGQSHRALVEGYAAHAWARNRGRDNIFRDAPGTTRLLVQASMVQVYALLSTPPGTYF